MLYLIHLNACAYFAISSYEVISYLGEIESESLIKRELAATDLSTVATALLTSGEKKVVELTVKNCKNLENEKRENVESVFSHF